MQLFIYLHILFKILSMCNCSVVKKICLQCRRCSFDPWVGSREDPLEESMATHSSCVGKIPWTEEPGGLWSIGSQRIEHNWSDLARMYAPRKGLAHKKRFMKYRVEFSETVELSSVRQAFLKILFSHPNKQNQLILRYTPVYSSILPHVFVEIRQLMDVLENRLSKPSKARNSAGKRSDFWRKLALKDPRTQKTYNQPSIVLQTETAFSFGSFFLYGSS